MLVNLILNVKPEDSIGSGKNIIFKVETSDLYKCESTLQNSVLPCNCRMTSVCPF